MKLNLTKNWIAKILSLLLATAIWFLIRDHVLDGTDKDRYGKNFPTEYDANGNVIPKAKPVRENR